MNTPLLKILKITAVFLLTFLFNLTKAQDYLISFSGSGASSTVDSVYVENLTQCTDTMLGGGDILQLLATLGINEISPNSDPDLFIFPNPMEGSCKVDFDITKAGRTTIELYDIAGNRILAQQESLLTGHYSYLLSGIRSGIFMLKIASANYTLVSKVISNNSIPGIIEMKCIETRPLADKPINDLLSGEKKDLKSNRSTIMMQYNAGDTLKFIGKSGIYNTIIILIPSQSQLVTFNFVGCTDGDGNNYPTVQIGTQIWMASNLKTTKYLNGSAIPNITDSAQWSTETSGAYCDYHNLPAEGNGYGHLYNWYTIADSRQVCPLGWHVASDSEWTVLTNFLGGDSIAGGKLKENCQTRWGSPNTGATNQSGFTGLCANFRSATGAWSMSPNNNHDANYWSSTSANSSMAWFRGLRYCYKDVFIAPSMYQAGFSIRCVKD